MTARFTKEDFEVWQTSHVSQSIYKLLDGSIRDCEDLWMNAINNFDLGPQQLYDLKVQLKARATVLQQVRTMTYEEIVNEPATNVREFPKAVV